jgi:hypothetical protein
VRDKKDNELFSNPKSFSDFLPISAIPRVKPLNVNPIIDDMDSFLRNLIPAHHVLLHHIGDGNDRSEALRSIWGILHPTAHPLFGAEDPPQEFYHPQNGILISPEASPKPRPVHTPMGLEDIRSQGISHPESNVVVVLRDRLSCQHSKRKEAEAFRERNGPYLMEMDSAVLFVPMLSIDMNLKIFAGHSSAEID